MSASGKRIIWKALVFINGVMEDPMKENMLMIKNMDTASIAGLTEEHTPDIGT